MSRPVRIYRHVFVNANGQTAPIVVVRSGVTPCQAKGRAFVGLEEELRDRPELPKGGWRLLQAQDISHTLPRLT